MVGSGDGTVEPVIVPDGVSAIRVTSLTGQPVGVEQWFDTYDYNAASATVSTESLAGTNVILEVFRLDGTRVDIRSGPVDYFAGWISTGFAEWSWQGEDVLLFRVTTTGAGPLLVDFAWVGVVE